MGQLKSSGKSKVQANPGLRVRELLWFIIWLASQSRLLNTKQAVDKHINQQNAEYKWPKGQSNSQEIPRNTQNKIEVLIREMFIGQLILETKRVHKDRFAKLNLFPCV